MNTELPFSCELEGVAVVLVGNFNPAIFQPMWLAKNQLVREEEAQAATIQLIRPELSSFVIGAINVVVVTNQFQAETAALDKGEVLKDLVVGCFRLLEHTPISSLVISRHMHFRMPSTEAWNRVGHMIVPKSPLWDGILENPGTRVAEIEGTRPTAPSGKLHFRIEPSLRVPCSVYIGTGERYEASTCAKDTTLFDVLLGQWADAQRFARESAEQLLGRCLEEKA